MSVNSKMTAIADAIRGKTGGTGKLNLDQMAIGVNDVYQAGYNAGAGTGGGGNYDEGYNDGIAEGIEQGKQAEYNRFWNALQNNGAAMDYTYAFAGSTWDDDCYNPKYPIKATACTNMFRNAVITDVKVPIDLSNGTGTHVLNNCRNLVNIPEIISNKNIDFTGWLAQCVALEEVMFSGVIGKSLSFINSPLLSANSINSICLCLSDTASNQTITFNSAVKETFHNAMSSGWGTTTADETWDRLCEENDNWTFVC